MNTRRSSKRRRLSRLPVRTILATSIIALSAPLVRAATFTWLDSNSGTLNWSVGAWTPATPTALDSLATTDLIFNGLGTTQYTATNDLANPFLLNTLTLNSSATVTQTIAGNQLDFRSDDTAAGITQAGSGAFTISAPILATNAMTLGGAGTGVVALNGVVSGGGGLSFTGGSWQIGNVGNTFTGAFTVGTGAFVEAVPSGAAPQAVILTSGTGLLSSAALTINGGTLKITTKGNGGNASGITVGGRTIAFGTNGGTFDLRNTSGVAGSQGGGILTAGGGDLNLTLNNSGGNVAVIQFNGGQNGHSTGSAVDGNWSVGNNALRVASYGGTGPARVEVTNGAMYVHNVGTVNVPVTVRGVVGGDPTSGPAAAVNAGISTTLGRLAVNTNTANFTQGLRLEDAIQIHGPGTTRALDGNIVVVGTAGGHGGYVVFNGRSTGTALGPAINPPGTNVANQNPLWIGQGQNDTLTIENGGVAVFDLRVRYEQGNHNGVVLDGRAVLNAGGTLRMAQSISNFSYNTAGLAGPSTTANVGDHVIRGDIEGQGTTALESVVDIQLPAPQAIASTGVPEIMGTPAANSRPHGGLRFEDVTGNADLIVNGSGFGGLRINGSARPNALFSGAIADPVTNLTKINDALPASRLTRVSGTGGYLTIAPSGQTYALPVGGEWTDADVGLKIVDHNSGGADVSLGALTSWSKNLAVDAGATLDTGAGAFALNGGTLHGTGTVTSAGSLAIGAAAAVSPGLAGIGTLTVGNITIHGTLNIETTNAPATDLLTVSGNFTLGGTSTLNLPLTNTYNSADYVIASYSGTLTGTFGSVINLPLGYSVNYGTGASSTVRLTFGTVTNRVWNGNLSGTWDTATANWQGAAVFANNDTVTFDDTASGPNFNVTIAAGGVTPSQTTVNNGAIAYSITSVAGAALGGSGQLLKTGTGLLTLSGPATYGGGTAINGGELRLGASNSLPDIGAVTVGAAGTLNVQANSDTVASLSVNGAVTGTGTITTPALTLGSGAAFSPNLVLNGTLSKTGAVATTLGGTINLGGGTRTFDVAAGTSPELVANGAISNGSLTKTGNGTLVLGAANSLTTVTANGGTLRVGVAGAIPTATVNTGAGGTLDLNGLVSTIGTLNNSGATTTGGAALTVTTLNGANTGSLNLGGGQLVINGGGGGTYAGAITGTGTSVVKQGAGVATLTGTSTHTGGTTINAGRLNAAGAPGGTLGITVNSGAVLQFTNTVTGPVHANAGATLSTTTGNNPVNGELFIDGDTALHLYDEGATGNAADFALGGGNPGNPTGTLRGSGNLTISSNQASADGGAGLRLRSTVASDYSGTITAGNRVKVELNSNTSGAFSPMGTGKVVLTAGTTNTPASLQGTYSQIQTRTNVTGTTTYGNNIELTGSGAANFNVLGAANTTAVMGDLKLGGGQSMFFNKNDAAADRTLVFPTVTLTGGNATFSVYDQNFRDNANAFVGPNVQFGAIGQTTPGAGAIFKAAGGNTAVAPFPHVTVTGVSTYTGPTDIQAGPLTVSATGSLASSSEIKMSAATAKLDVVPFGAGGYNIPAAQKVSGIGDWDGRLNLNGTLAPGLSIGTLTGDNFTLNGAGIMQFELSTLDNASDKLTLSGAFEKGTAGAFQFDFEGGGLNGQTYTLVQFATTTFAVTDFTYADLGAGLGGSFVLNANDLQFVVIPEPGSATLLVCAMIGLAGFRRRR